MKRLQAQCDRIEARIETMYMDKLDGHITQEFFDRQAANLRKEQDGLQRKIQEIQKATPVPVDQAIDMLRLTSRASELFLQQNGGVCCRAWWKRPPGRTAGCRQICSNRLRFCGIRTAKVIERKRRSLGQDVIWISGSPHWTRFELLRAKWRRDRTPQAVILSI
jgi:hypothetical protein